jgi:prolyl-tRNA synthetase
MKWTNMFIPTMREDSAAADAVSHKLLIRAGFIRQLTAGVYSLLPLAQRVRLKIIGIIREEMTRIGGQEFVLPALHPAELWKESGRWQSLDEILFRFKDRKGGELVLGMTHEEVFTTIARNTINSYRQLPQIWYQIQTKFRDELRPKSGLLRVREFTMKDSYSFDVNEAGLDLAFAAHHDAYCRIFARCGVTFTAVEADSGAMGGSQSTEFMTLSDAGEDTVVICNKCGYAANTEKAVADCEKILDGDEQSPIAEFPTPNIKTIDQLAKCPGAVAPQQQIKTLVYSLNDKLALVLLRGDHDLNECKLQALAGTANIRPALVDEIVKALGAEPGSLGAVGIDAQNHSHISRVIADNALLGRHNMATGANRNHFHLNGVSVERDLKIDQWADLRSVRKDDLCRKCAAPLVISKALEIGHIFKLGTRYSQIMEAYVLNSEGNRVPLVMGSYGIGVERLLAAVVELSHDASGIIWPAAVAPFQVVITPVNTRDQQLMNAAERIHAELEQAGVEVLLDDRDERAGVKFNDADLIGIPLRITVGKKIAQNTVELFTRATKTSRDVSVESILAAVQAATVQGAATTVEGAATSLPGTTLP